jgi:peptidoglycan hydrolase CwlO-like protein
MNEKKTANRPALIATLVLCFILLVSLGIAVFNYNSLLNAKDALIASKDLQIADEASQTSDLEAATDEKQSEIEDLNAQIAEKDSTISDLNQQISQKNSQITSLNSEISQKDSTITSLKDQSSVTEDLNEQISQKDNQISNLNSQISSLTNQVTDLNSQLLQKNATISNLADQISLLENTTSALASEVSELNSQILGLNNQIASLQTQNYDLTSEIATLNSQMATLQLAYDNYVAAYQNLREIVNQRVNHINISDFITPNDPSVISVVYTVTGGWSNTSDWSEYWSDVKALCNWVATDTNIDYRGDGLSPILPFNPSEDLNYGGDMWQFPNETLNLKQGDCEDQAILLCSMIRCYSNYATECIWITSSTAAHVGVQIRVSGDKLVIFDPAGEYFSNDGVGNIVFNDFSVAIDDWFTYWVSMGVFSSDVYVYRVFSDYVDIEFSSTSEYLSWMYS